MTSPPSVPRGRSPPLPSPPPSPPFSPSRLPEAPIPSSTTNPFLQPLNPVQPSVFSASSPAAAVSAARLSRSPSRAANVLAVANGSPPASGSASSPPPPAPPSPEAALSNEQILSMLRPLVRVLHDRGVLNPATTSAPFPPKFPEPSVHITSGTGTSGVPHSITTKYEGTMGPSHYVAINMKAALQNKSLEELRLEDYNLAKAAHPLSTAHNPPAPQPNHNSTFSNPSSSKKVSFTDPPTSPNPAPSRFTAAANGTGPAPNHTFKFPLFPLASSNNASSLNPPSFISSLPFPSAFQRPSHQSNSHSLANNNSSNTFATNWLSNDVTKTVPNSFKPRGNPSTFINSSNSFSFPSGAQSASNEAPCLFGHSAAPSSFSAPSQSAVTGGGDGGAAANQPLDHTFNRVGAGGYSQTVMHKQTFTTPAGENHGPVLNEIQVSQTAYFPHGWFC